jgi:transposase
LRRSEVLQLFSRLEPALIGIEACQTSHYWAREITALGHEVRLMPPQFVKPYVKSQKNDAADAEAICEAVQRPSMRFVPVKTADQQATLLLHRTRELLIRQRSSLISAIRSHFAEFGIVACARIRNIDRLLALLEDAEARLPELARRMLQFLSDQLREVAARVAKIEAELLAWHQQNDVSRRLAAIPGVGPITASAIVATIGDANQFKSARQFSAWLGLVPQQRSSGGKERLGRISKRGDGYLRRLLIHGARAVVGWRKRRPISRDGWLNGLLTRRPVNVATVAFANKNARIIWALLARSTDYRSGFAHAA